MSLVVDQIQPLRAGGGGQAGDDVDIARLADRHGEIGGDMAGLDEVLVDLGLVEAAHDGPDGVERRVDALGEEGGGLGGRVDSVGVELGDCGAELGELGGG